MNILVLMHGGTNSRDIFTDVVHGIRGAGHHALVLEIDPLFHIIARNNGNASEVQADLCRFIAAFIRENNIDLTVAMWANGIHLLGLRDVNGRAVTFFEAINAPHLLLWLDAPERAHSSTMIQYFRSPVVNSPNLFHFINNAGTAHEMTALFGFANVLPVPYGVNTTAFTPPVPPVDLAGRTYDLMFSVGGGEGWLVPSPEMREEVSRDQPDTNRIRLLLAQQVRPQLDALAARYDEPRRPAAREAMEQLLSWQIRDRHKPMVDRLQDIAAAEPALAQGVQTLAAHVPTLVETMAAVRSIDAFWRIFTFVYLTRYFNCGLFGTADLSAWGCSIPSAGFVPYRQQAQMYAQARAGLSVMRYQDELGVHIKPLEIAASGTACLASWRPGIDTLFGPDEILIYHTLEEARTRLADALAAPDRLAAIAHAGLQRVRRDHTWARRITLILELVERMKRR